MNEDETMSEKPRELVDLRDGVAYVRGTTIEAIDYAEGFCGPCGWLLRYEGVDGINGLDAIRWYAQTLQARLASPTLVDFRELDCVELDSRFGGWMADHHPLGLRGRGATPQAAVDALRAKMRDGGGAPGSYRLSADARALALFGAFSSRPRRT